MNKPSSLEMNALSSDDLEMIDCSNLSMLKRHHLRLLAHCLACFQAIAKGSKTGPLPSQGQRKEWCCEQPGFANEKNFIPVFLDQLDVAGSQLEELANTCGVSPLELKIEDLIRESLS